MLPSVEAKLSSPSSQKEKHKASSSDSDSSEDEMTKWVDVGTTLEASSVKLENLEPKKSLERVDRINLAGSFSCSSRQKRQKKENGDKKKRRDMHIGKTDEC